MSISGAWFPSLKYPLLWAAWVKAVQAHAKPEYPTRCFTREVTQCEICASSGQEGALERHGDRATTRGEKRSIGAQKAPSSAGSPPWCGSADRPH